MPYSTLTKQIKFALIKVSTKGQTGTEQTTAIVSPNKNICSTLWEQCDGWLWTKQNRSKKVCCVMLMNNCLCGWTPGEHKLTDFNFTCNHDKTKSVLLWLTKVNTTVQIWKFYGGWSTELSSRLVRHYLYYKMWSSDKPKKDFQFWVKPYAWNSQWFQYFLSLGSLKKKLKNFHHKKISVQFQGLHSLNFLAECHLGAFTSFIRLRKCHASTKTTRCVILLSLEFPILPTVMFHSSHTECISRFRENSNQCSCV